MRITQFNTCGFRINANLVKEGSFRINAKLVNEELNIYAHIYVSDSPGGHFEYLNLEKF